MKDNTLHNKKDGRMYQMLDGYSRKPIPFKDAKHNYTRREIDEMECGEAITFKPMYGNDNPVCSILVRIR